jgi:hypothetical protein
MFEDFSVWIGVGTVVAVIFFIVRGFFSQNKAVPEANEFEKEVEKQKREIIKMKKQIDFFLEAMHKPFLDSFKEFDKVITNLLKNEIERLQSGKIEIISGNFSVSFDKNDNLTDKLKKIKVITDKRLNECKEIESVINDLKIDKMQDLYNKLLVDSTTYDIDLMIKTYKLISDFLIRTKSNV